MSPDLRTQGCAWPVQSPSMQSCTGPFRSSLQSYSEHPCTARKVQAAACADPQRLRTYAHIEHTHYQTEGWVSESSPTSSLQPRI